MNVKPNVPFAIDRIASTDGLYDPLSAPRRETDDYAAGPLAFYSATKRSAELAAAAYGAYFAVAILRLFRLRSRPRHRHASASLLDSAKEGRPLELHGHDGMRFDPVHVSKAAKSVETALGVNGVETINVAGSEILTMRRVGQHVSERLGIAWRFVVESEPPHPDLVALLSSPAIGVGKGIAEMCAAARPGAA